MNSSFGKTEGAKALSWAFSFPNKLTNSPLTLWIRILLQKLTVPHPFKQFPAFYDARRYTKYLTAPTTACHLSLP
jgi:hypothetical protein